MIVSKIQVSGAIAHTLYKKVIPAGIIGAQVEFEYAEDIWKGLHKTVVFRGPVTKDVVINDITANGKRIIGSVTYIAKD